MNSICAALGVLLFGQVAALAEEPSFAVESQSMMAGAGLPGGKPLDIVGLFAGMPGSEAEAKLDVLAKEHGANADKWHGKLKYAKEGYLAAARVQHADETGKEAVLILLTSNAAGNQVMAVNRFTHYEPGHEPGTAAFLDAIRGKYGEPSDLRQRDTDILINYRFVKGAIERSAEQCMTSYFTGQGADSVDPTNLFNMSWRIAQGNEQIPHPCSASLFIHAEFARGTNGLFNPKAIGSVWFGFADDDRITFAVRRDAEVGAQLEQKARDAATIEGTAKPKL